MSFDWKAFEEGKLAYNARTEEDAKAFLEECEERGVKKSTSLISLGPVHWKMYGEYTCYRNSSVGILHCDIALPRYDGCTIFSEPWKKQESVVDMLRRWGSGPFIHCVRCKELLGGCVCMKEGCRSFPNKLADMVEAELKKAKQTRCTGYVDSLASLGRLPERNQGETLEKYLDRTHVVLPRWDNDEIVSEGDPYGDTSVEHVCVYSDGDWLINMADGSTLEGTLNQRAVRIEPDTQERIDEDARKCAFTYWGCSGLLCSSCPSLVDGRIPKERYGVIDCLTAQRLDILRRQREFDARTIGGEQ